MIYGNLQQGILAAGGGPGAMIANNTIFQPLGDAIRVQGGTVGLDAANIWTQTGYDLFIDSNSQVGYKSDYNVLYTTSSGRVRLVARNRSSDAQRLAQCQFYGPE